MLAASEVVTYLLDNGLMRANVVVDHAVQVGNVSRRNCNFVVVVSGQPGFFVKQAIPGRTDGTVNNEGHVLQQLAETMDGKLERNWLPELCHYDRQQGIVVTRLVNSRESLRQYFTRVGKYRPMVAYRAGKVLAELHSLTAGTAPNGNGIGEARPWTFSIHRPDLAFLDEMSKANYDFIRLIQRFPAVGAALEQLARTWSPSCYIHQDIKWDNYLVESPRGRAGPVTLVDWEACCYGDPAWDIGSFFSEFLCVWLYSFPVAEGTPPSHFLQMASQPLESMHAAIKEFWKGYTYVARHDNAEERDLLLRSVAMAAPRMFQFAFESMQQSSGLSGNAVCALQVGQNILGQPAEAAIRLLNLPLNLLNDGG